MPSAKQELTMAFVVLVISAEEKPSLKVFRARLDARSYAQKQINEGAERTDIYEIPHIDDARKAKAALEMGDGMWLEAKSHNASTEQIEAAELREYLESCF
jgi:hypothetical protein